MAAERDRLQIQVHNVHKVYLTAGINMDENALIAFLNAFIQTDYAAPITSASAFYQTILKDGILLHNQSYTNLLVQAYMGRYFLLSGEHIVVSLANNSINRRELYQEIRHTLLEMMLMVAMGTLAFVLVRDTT